MEQEVLSVSVAALLEKINFTEKDALLLPLYLVAPFEEGIDIYLDFKNMKTSDNAIRLLYDKISYMYGYNKVFQVHVVNSGLNLTVNVTPYFTEQRFIVN